jgi:tetratricopeptide (TPR) repeat protein
MGRTGDKRGVHRKRAELLIRQEVYLLFQGGKAALRRGHLRDAEESLRKVLSIEPMHRAALAALGELHLRRDDYAGACEYLERAIDAGDRSEHLLYLTANACRGAQRREKAFKYLEQLVEQNPGHVRGATRLGEAYLARKDFERARALFAQALEIDSRNLYALRGLAAALRGKRDYRAAIAVYEELLRQDPGDNRVIVRLAEAYAHEGDASNARRAYHLALQVDPENHYAKEGLSQLA